MEKLADKFYGKLKHEAVKLKREAKKIAELETPLEKNIREATSSANWNCSNTILYELSSSVYDYRDRYKIMSKVWEKLDNKTDKWRRVIKTLTLLEFLIKNGPDSLLGEVQGQQNRVRRLTEYYAYEDGQDRGSAIREKAKFVLELINDQELLRNEREKAKEHKAKFFSPGSSESFSQGGGSRQPSNREANDNSRKAMERRFEELKQKRDAERAATRDRFTVEETSNSQRREGSTDRSQSRTRRDGSDDDRPRRGDSPRKSRDADSDSDSAPRRKRDPERNPGTQALFDLIDKPGGSGGAQPTVAAPVTPAMDLLDMDGDSQPVAPIAAPPVAQSVMDADFGFGDAAPAAPDASDDWGGFASASPSAAPVAAPAPMASQDDFFGDAMFQSAAPSPGVAPPMQQPVAPCQGSYQGFAAPAPFGGGMVGGYQAAPPIFTGAPISPPPAQAAAPATVAAPPPAFSIEQQITSLNLQHAKPKPAAAPNAPAAVDVGNPFDMAFS